MKRPLILCLALVATMASCLKEPNIYRLLPAEDAAAIPYTLGDSIAMLNQDGDTIHFVVTYDTTDLYADYDAWEFVGDYKFDFEPGPWCYARTVQLQSGSDSTRTRMEFSVLPEKAFDFQWDSWRFNSQLTGETQTLTLDNTTYEHVYLRQKVDTETGEPIYQWYYSEEAGLILVKYNGKSLMRIPNRP